MLEVLVALAIISGLMAAVVVFAVYKANKFKNSIEDTVIDGVKQVIVEHGPEAVKYVKGKIEKNKKD